VRCSGVVCESYRSIVREYVDTASACFPGRLGTRSNVNFLLVCLSIDELRLSNTLRDYDLIVERDSRGLRDGLRKSSLP
jgi:hypothetical protein